MVSIAMFANDGKYVSIAEISTMHHLPTKVLENVVMNLRFNNLVVSRRGCKNGGYKLAKPPKDITLTEIIQALDNNMLCENNNTCKCDNIEVTINKGLWHKVNQSILGVTNNITLYSIIEQAKI